MMRHVCCALGLAVALTTGCSTRRVATRETIDMTIRALPVYDRECDVEFAAQATAGQLKLLEGLLESAPDDPELLLALARGYARYACGIVQLRIECAEQVGYRSGQDYWTAQAGDFYRRARSYGLRLLKVTRPGFTDALAGTPTTLASELEGCDAGQAPALYWTAFAWGNQLALEPINAGRLGDLGKTALLMHRVAQLDEGMMYGGAHLYLGAYYSRVPALFGGSRRRAAEHFRRARQIGTDSYLPARLVQAECLRRATGDPGDYIAALRELVAASDTSRPEYNLDNAVARRLAAIRLATVDSSFVCDCAGPGFGYWAGHR